MYTCHFRKNVDKLAGPMIRGEHVQNSFLIEMIFNFSFRFNEKIIYIQKNIIVNVLEEKMRVLNIGQYENLVHTGNKL